MDDRPLSILHYLPVSPRDEQWGIVCTCLLYTSDAADEL